MQTPWAGGTTVTLSHMTGARALARSFVAHNTDAKFVVAILDATRSQAADLSVPGEFDAIGLEQLASERLGIDAVALHRMAAIYSPFEFACAAKPLVLEYLLHAGSGAAIYLDGDVWVTGSLATLAVLASERGVVICASRRESPIRDGAAVEQALLFAGTINAGIIAVGQDGDDFVSWWSDRLRWHCLDAPEQALHCDQRWLDLVPGYFSHAFCADPGINAMAWNLDERPLARDGRGWRVDDAPLRAFHFTGFDPDHREILSKYVPETMRDFPGTDPLALASLCEAYAIALGESASHEVSIQPYRFSQSADGLDLTPAVRIIIRSAMLAAKEAGYELTIDPFSKESPSGLCEWIRTPLDASDPWSPSPMLLGQYLGSADLRAQFPDVPGTNASGLSEWLRTVGNSDLGIPRELLPEPAPWTPGGLAPVDLARDSLAFRRLIASALAVTKGSDLEVALAPFDEQCQWLRTPIDPQDPWSPSPILLVYYSKYSNLREQFPVVPGPDSYGFREWMRVHGPDALGLPLALAPDHPTAGVPAGE